MPKKKTLTEALPDPVEQLRGELNALKAVVAIQTEEIQALKTVSDTTVSVINELHDETINRIDEVASHKMESQQLQALQSIAASLEGIHQIKKAYADKMNGKEAARKEQAQNGGDTPSPFNLKGDPAKPTAPTPIESIPHIDALKVHYTQEGVTLTPKKFLGDLWGPVNEEVRSRGGRGGRDGKQSHWLIEGAPPAGPQGVQT